MRGAAPTCPSVALAKEDDNFKFFFGGKFLIKFNCVDNAFVYCKVRHIRVRLIKIKRNN